MTTPAHAWRTPAGARLSVTTWGRDFKMLDIDRWLVADWPEAARPELRRLAEALVRLAMWTRRKASWMVVSSFVSCGTIYAPNAVVDELLAVLVSAEHGDISWVTPVADLAAEAVAAVAAVRSKVAKSVAARLAVEEFVRGVQGRTPALRMEAVTAAASLSPS